jgi:membrane carboxypeptidase/penicillin-binding protein PbpC
LDLGRPAAAKTGTTTDYRDNWTLGYTPNLVVGVWVGNANNLPMVDVTGVSGAAPIWNDFMRRVLTGQPELGFTRPEGLERVTICALSGMLPTAACPLTREEWFITGTAPTQPDTLYRLIEIDSVTGRVADANTPPERRVQQSFVILPPEAREWGRRNGMFVPAGYDDFTTIISTTNTSAAFRILTPAPYRIFQVTTALPAGQQRIRLSVVPPNGTRQVHYSLNGEVIATVEAAPYDAWWTLAIGEYRLAATATLVDGTQQTTEPIIFSVVEETEPQSRNVP